MAEVTILKNTRRQAAVSFVGSGNATLDINDVIYHDQTLDEANAVLTISHIFFSIGDGGGGAFGKAANITRGGNLILQLAGSTSWNLAQEAGIVIDKNANASIEVDMPDAVGTVILTLSKQAGFIDPDRQHLMPFER